MSERTAERAVTVASLALAKLLPVEFLRSLELADISGGGVAIPYFEHDGSLLFTRERDRPGCPRFQQPRGVKLVPYGRWRLEDARRAGLLYLVEGESDCWTLWHHGLPALGLPGSQSAACLTAEDLVGLHHLYLWREPDHGGRAFVEGAARRARALGFRGRVQLMSLPEVKDPSELHARDPHEFPAGWGRAIENAGPVWPAQAEANGKHESNGKSERLALTFPPAIPASELKTPEAPPWLWHGYLARGGITLLTALWKAGKTTLLAHLMHALGRGEEFCGRELTAAQVLYVTEEGEGRWARRRDAVGIADNVHFLIRPFLVKPDWAAWRGMIAHLAELRKARPVDLIVMDTLVDLWPVRDENDASQVQAALMPLRQVVQDEKSGLLLVHHNRKGDGQEATASRGSGALTSFVDTIVELRRYDAGEKTDRRRVLTAYGRDEETPEELVVELGEGGYRPQGDRHQAAVSELECVLHRLLPNEAPGWTVEQIKENWLEGDLPSRKRLLDALRFGASRGKWHCEGDGKRGSPFTYWIAPPLHIFT